ncbi:MAG: cytochrome c maturation protein CcmE [Pseudomonadota bacterium]
MTRKQKRAAMIAGCVAVLGVAVGLVLVALQDSIVFFHSPSEVVEKSIQPGTRFRLGGLVEKGSIKRGDGLEVAFTITDGAATRRVRFNKILPDLFREEQGVVAEGRLNAAGDFEADTVLAKHDENYMPPEVAAALKKQGVWQGETGATGVSE